MSQDSDLRGITTLSQELGDTENEPRDNTSTRPQSVPVPPTHAASPCRWSSPSSPPTDEEVASSVKEEQTYESIEEASAYPPFNSSIDEFSVSESYSQPVQSSIETFGESLNQEEQAGPSSINTFEAESMIEEPSAEQSRRLRAISIGSSLPEEPSQMEDESPSQYRLITVESQDLSNREEQRLSSPLPVSDQDSVFMHDRVPMELDPLVQRQIPRSSSRIPSPYHPLSDLRHSPVRENQKNGNFEQRSATPISAQLDDFQLHSPASPAQSTSSDQEGSELSVARLVMVSGSQSPEKLSTIPESAPYSASPVPAQTSQPEAPREVIDLSTPSANNSPVRSEAKVQEGSSLFKIKLPQVRTPPSLSPVSPVRKPIPISIPSTPVTSTSASTSARPQRASPTHILSSTSSPLSDPPSSDKPIPLFLDSDSDVEIIPVKKRQAEPTNVTVKTEPASKPKKILNLKAGTLGQPSAAMTRVRKRKTKPVDSSEEPPLKRARERSIFSVDDEVKVKTENNSISVKRTANARAKGKGKEKEPVIAPQRKTSNQRTRTPRKSKAATPKTSKAAQWPPLPTGNEGFFMQVKYTSLFRRARLTDLH